MPSWKINHYQPITSMVYLHKKWWSSFLVSQVPNFTGRRWRRHGSTGAVAHDHRADHRSAAEPADGRGRMQRLDKKERSWRENWSFPYGGISNMGYIWGYILMGYHDSHIFSWWFWLVRIVFTALVLWDYWWDHHEPSPRWDDRIAAWEPQEPGRIRGKQKPLDMWKSIGDSRENPAENQRKSVHGGL